MEGLGSIEGRFVITVRKGQVLKTNELNNEKT